MIKGKHYEAKNHRLGQMMSLSGTNWGELGPESRPADVARRSRFHPYTRYWERLQLIEDFRARFIVDAITSCWNWTGYISNHRFGGYGKIRIQGKYIAAHRLSFWLWKGQNIVGLQILHRCDNRKCVNPDHLTAGTQSQNIKDAIAKGRFPQCGRK